MLSFDITDRNIKIIKGTENNGKIRISSATTLNLEEEVIVNGHVRDVPRLATQINQVLRTNKMPDKEAIVSISSNMTIFKELHIQKADKQTDFMKMVRAEMAAALGIDESYSVSYIIVGDSDQTDGAVKVLATACPYEVVDCYKRVFNMLQINLRSVMIGCNCITKVLLADTKVKSKMPLLAVQIDNNFISLNLYEKGQLSFSRFASISAEDYDDSEDYVFEAVGDTHEYVRLTNELEKMGIRTSIINVPPQIHGYENLEFSSYANAIGAMFKRNKDTERINLLETDTVNNNRIKSDSSYALLLGVCALAAVGLCFAGWLVLKLQNNSVQKEIDEYTAKQECQLTKKLDEQIAMLAQKQVAVNTYVDGVTDAYNAFKSRPKPQKSQYEMLEKTILGSVQKVLDVEDEEAAKKKCTFQKFDYSGGVYSIELTVDREKDNPMSTLPETIISDLRSKSEIQNVNYTGYRYDEAEKTADDVDDEADDEGNEGENDAKKSVIKMELSVTMNGDKVDIFALTPQAEEEAAQ